MRKMMLSSGALTPELGKELLALLPGKPEEMTVAVVSNASDVLDDKGYLLKGRGELESLGLHNFVDIDLRVPDDLAKLDDCQLIVVSGGNTFYLLKVVRESGFDQKLKELFANDKVYLGFSAGSIILGTSIETSGVGPTADKNADYIDDLRGLRQVPFMVAVHMDKKEKIYFDQFARSRPLRPIIGIEDGMAIVCEGDRYRVIGPGKVQTWSSKLFR